MPRALGAVREKRVWWKQNRDKAPGLFLEELAAAVRKLRAGLDNQRQRIALRDGRTAWRILMPKTRLHLFYRVVDAHGVIEVLAISNAVAGSPPDL